MEIELTLHSSSSTIPPPTPAAAYLSYPDLDELEEITLCPSDEFESEFGTLEIGVRDSEPETLENHKLLEEESFSILDFMSLGNNRVSIW